MDIRPSFSFDVVGISGIILAVVLLVLDKAGKLRGGLLIGLLCLAGVMTLFLALGNSFVLDAPAKWRFWRGLLMFCVVAFVYSGLAIWISSGGTPRELPAGAEEPKPDPYVLTLNVTMFTPLRTGNCSLWAIYYGDGHDILPVNTAIHFSLNNDQDFPAMISNYEVTMRTADGSWAKLIRLDTKGKLIYIGAETKNLKLVTDASVFFDNLIYNKNIGAHETIRGWALFEYPRGYGPTFIPEFQITVTDYSGKSHVSPILTSSPGSSKAGAQGADIPISGTYVDFSGYNVKHADD